MTTLDEVYDALLELGYCRNQQDFSRNWLGRSGSYFAYLKSTRARPSPSSLGMLAAQLRAMLLTSTSSTAYVERRRLRSAWVAVMTMWMGERELLHAKPWERVTAVDVWER